MSPAMSKISNTFALFAALIATVAGHTSVEEFIANGVSYAGYYQGSKVDPQNNSPAWWTNQQWGYQPIYGNEMGSPDFIAHKDASPSPHTAPVAAGSDVTFKWHHKGTCNNGEEGWDCSHHGWTTTYLAPCNGDCANVDKTALKFFKIHESALIDYRQGRFSQGEAPNAYSGYWGTDAIFYDNNNAQTVTIPTGIPSGGYVLRTEVMSIHNNEGIKDVQFWPQAFNVQVTGGDDSAPVPAGTKATELYNAKDAIFSFDLYWHTPGETFATAAGPPVPAAVAASLSKSRKHRRHARAHSRAFSS